MATAWIDVDGNGIWDANELPLEGVTFTLNYRSATFKRVSDTKGEVWLAIRRNCLAFARPEIQAQALEDYKLTTPGMLRAKLNREDTYQFGFQPINSNTEPQE